jgi:uncharacterized membrane protein YdbT with pleckstrin-like domain
MAFPKKLLNEGEEVLADLHPHWAYFTQPVLVLVGGIALGIVTLVATTKGVPRTALGVVSLVVLAVGVVWVLLRLLKWLTTNIVVTSDRLVFRSGTFAKSGMEIPIDRVMNVNFKQTFWERLIGSGDLLIESGGEDGLQTFSNIRRPETLQKLIMGRTRSHIGNAAPAAPTDAATQLEKLAGLLEKGHISQAEFDAQKAKLLS